MDKSFKFAKWVVLFCGLLVVVWATRQYVSTARLKKEACKWGELVFTWSWPGDWSSRAEMTDAAVVQRTDNDAVVKVHGKQYLTIGGQSTPVDCTAVLTFYKRSEKDTDYWELGEVQFQ